MQWNAKVEDPTGKLWTYFIRGPKNEEEARYHAGLLSRNWKLLSVEHTDQKQPPEDARPIPKESYEYGVLKEINARRRR